MQCGLSSLEERPHFLPEAPFLPEALTCKSKILFSCVYIFWHPETIMTVGHFVPIYEKNVRNAQL